MASAATTTTTPRHQWSQALDPVVPGSRTEIAHSHDDATSSSHYHGIVSVYEADRLVDALESYAVEDVGGSSFLRDYGCAVERLSLQAHATAASDNTGDEYVVESILTHHKLPVLVRTLLAVEAWRTYVLPELSDKLKHNVLRVAFTLHTETTLVSLLTLVLYRKESVEGLDSETAVALVDYCARNMTALAVPVAQNDMVRRQKEPLTAAGLSHRVTTRSPSEEINDHRLDTEFKTCVATVALARHLCEHLHALPLSARTRILDTHDLLVGVVPLLDNPPWTRRTLNNAWEKLSPDHTWIPVPPDDLLLLTQCEAQCWLLFWHLTGERYGLNDFRKAQLLRVRKFLHDTLCDQLPVLADVTRFLDELSLTDVSGCDTGQGGVLKMQQVALVREELVKGRVWRDVAVEQHERIFSQVTDATDEVLRSISDVYGSDGIEDVVGGADVSSVDDTVAAQEVDSVTIRLVSSTGGSADEVTESYTLVRAETTPNVGVQTPNGPFERIKMTPEDNDSNNRQPVDPNAKIVVDVTFVGRGRRTLTCDDVRLPSLGGTNDDDNKRFASYPSMEWRQLGSLQEQLALQIGFKKRHEEHVHYGPDKVACYAIHVAFLSKPSRK